MAKSRHTDSSTEWQLTARKETKTIQKAQLPRTAHFKVLLYSRIHMQWGKDFPPIPLIFPDHLISPQRLCSESQNIRAGQDLSDQLSSEPSFSEHQERGPNTLTSWMPITQPVGGRAGNSTQVSWLWAQGFLLPGRDMLMCLCYSLCPLKEQQNKTKISLLRV